ncbi:PKD domain-containing protein [Hymenobacter sp. BRD67]|nr:PKD domain-containing protein [Hymenobacter sp. BRD67]
MGVWRWHQQQPFLSPAHTYAKPGGYEVRLLATNAFGTDTLRYPVAVAAACPTYCTSSGNGAVRMRASRLPAFNSIPSITWRSGPTGRATSIIPPAIQS